MLLNCFEIMLLCLLSTSFASIFSSFHRNLKKERFAVQSNGGAISVSCQCLCLKLNIFQFDFRYGDFYRRGRNFLEIPCYFFTLLVIPLISPFFF